MHDFWAMRDDAGKSPLVRLIAKSAARAHRRKSLRQILPALARMVVLFRREWTIVKPC